MGFATEGTVGDRRRISAHLQAAPSLPFDASIAALAELLEHDAPRFPVPVIDDAGILLGTVDPAAAALPAPTRVDAVMAPGPGTIRPELRLEEAVERLRQDGLEQALVTAVNGVLLGRLVLAELDV